MNGSKRGHFLAHWAIQMPKSAQIFLQTSADICRKNFIATNSFFYTVISLNIKWSHINFAIQIMNLQKNFLYMFEKITLFCISICIMKLIDQKTQNNFCSTQIIVGSTTCICLLRMIFHPSFNGTWPRRIELGAKLLISHE